MRSATRPMTVKPNAAPKETMRNQVPTRAIRRVTASCSLEKKK